MTDPTPILTDATHLRANVHAKALAALGAAFPLETRGKRLEVEDLKVHAKHYSPDEQRRALLTGGTLHEAVKGTLVLKDAEGKVLDRATNFTLVHLPYMTERHTLIADGNEYQVANQLRRKPGVYTARADNGELRSIFNLGRGANFDVGFTPEKGTFHLEYGTSNIPLYPVLRALGIDHQHIADHWGKGVADANAAIHGKTHDQEKAIAKLYARLEHPSQMDPKLPHGSKVEVVQKRYGMTTLDPRVTEATLGKAFDKVDPHAMVAAAKKILAVHEGRTQTDDTDALTFKTFHSIDDFIGERIRLTARAWSMKAKHALSSKAVIREALRPAPFSDALKKFITTSNLTAVPTGINPLELIDHAVKVTSLGEGGIPSDRAIPLDARMIHNTHFGSLDPIRTPESNHSGVDIRATIAAHRDGEGNLYTVLRNVKTGKNEFIRAGDQAKHVIAFPGEDLKGKVDAFVEGRIKKVDGWKVTHQLGHISHVYSPATTLIPGIHSIQGNRAIMGSKMGTQALPLLAREVPFLQVKSHLPGSVSFEELYGHMIVPTAPVDGTIHKIEDGWVYIKPTKAKATEKTSNDRPVLHTKTLGPMTFNIEIPKGVLHRGRGSSADYGHLPGYVGPDGDSLDFFVGNHPDGAIFSYDKQKKYDSPDWRTTDVKFVVGMSPEDETAFHKSVKDRDTNNVRFANLRRFKGWDELQSHIDEHHKAPDDSTEKTASADTPYVFAEGLEKRAEGFGTIWANHAAMNAGLAGRDAKYVTDFPGADGKLESAKKRIPRLADDIIYGLLPPQWTHGDEDLSEMDQGKFLEWARYGYAPWDHPNPVTGVKHASAKEDADLVKVPYQTLFPFPSKTYLHHDLEVKKGDKVEAGQRLGESNFTRKGTLALGKNLRVAYMPYYGLNSNDAVVISEGCSKKLTSEHMYREVFQLTPQIELVKGKHQQYYGTKYSAQQYAVLDEHGVIKKGTTVHHKDPLILGVTKTQVTGTDALLGRLSKSLSRPYQEVALTWEHGSQGEVVDVVRTGSQITVLVRTHEIMQVGDKLAGRYGNKGVVAKIIPDHEMLQDARGNPIDLLLTSAGVISRINPMQVVETAVGKVVERTGKPIHYDNNERKDATKWATDLLKQHGISDKERVFDPVLKRHIEGGDGKGVLVGRQYIYKLFKSTDTNFAGHGVGPYDLNEQPLKTGGDDSAKGLGKMEFDALVAHNARHFLQEASTLKSQKNDEYWKAIQLGAPLPTPKPTFAFRKFLALLEGAGLRVDKRDSKFKLLPMTDKDVLERSRGAIQNSKTLKAKNLHPEAGGLFDPVLTGGPQGTLYSHIDLPEPMPHPVFKEPIRRLLNLTEKEFDAKLGEHGGAWFRDQLKEIHVPSRIKVLRARMVNAKGAELNDIVKQIKYLNACEKEGYKPHEAYITTKIPVMPPVFRPILSQPNDPGQVMIGDANKLYGYLMDSNHTLKTTAMESDRAAHRQQVFNAVAALYGTEDVANDELRGQQVKGFLSNIAGVGTPKGGFFQRKLMRRNQDVSGRGTAVPDANLGMDHVGIPEAMLWGMYDKLVTARLIRQGYPALRAKEMVLKKEPAARAALMQETRERPVLINRAPTLHRWSIVAAHPVPVEGKTIRVNPFIEKGMNLDYDGDTLQVHVPVGIGAIEDANRMRLSEMLLSDQSRNQLMAFPQHEAIIGFTHASKAKGNGKATQHFETTAAAMAAYRNGHIALTDDIQIGHQKNASFATLEDVLSFIGGLE